MSEEGRYKRGKRFQEQVARWLKSYFNDFSTVEVTQNQQATGISVMSPYQIDVHVYAKGAIMLGLFQTEFDVWVKCKWKDKSSVKRIELMKLIESARDVYKACQKGRNSIYYNVLMLVSNQKFDSDSLAYATQEDVLCVRFEGKKYELQNDLNWLQEPEWLKRLS